MYFVEGKKGIEITRMETENMEDNVKVQIMRKENKGRERKKSKEEGSRKKEIKIINMDLKESVPKPE